ncbi:MAG: helix-turn-helix transcriptional regulator [Solirubrobacterales bacterium]
MGGTNPTAAQLGIAIRELRKRRDLTLEDLAGIAELHTTHLSAIERGVTNPGWEKIRSLATAFGIDSSALIRLAETVARSPTATGAGQAQDGSPSPDPT